jgi:hypothetical protein
VEAGVVEKAGARRSSFLTPPRFQFSMAYTTIARVPSTKKVASGAVLITAYIISSIDACQKSLLARAIPAVHSKVKIDLSPMVAPQIRDVPSRTCGRG